MKGNHKNMNQIDKALKNIDAVIFFLKFGGIVVFDQKDITFWHTADDGTMADLYAGHESEYPDLNSYLLTVCRNALEELPALYSVKADLCTVSDDWETSERLLIDLETLKRQMKEVKNGK